MNEELYKQFMLQLGRLGVNVNELEKQEKPVIDQSAIVDAIVGQERFIKPKVDEYIKKHDGILVSKMNKNAIDLGIAKEKVEEANGDIAKLFGLVNEHIKAEAGKGDDENTAKIQQLHKAKQELELALAKKEEEFNTQLETVKSESQSNLAKMETRFAIKNSFSSLNLADNVRKNVDDFSLLVEKKITDSVDLKTVDGKRLAFKKGTEEPVFVDGTTDQADLNYLTSHYTKQLNLVKVTDVNGNGDPNTPGGNPSKKKEPEVYSKYGNALQ
jgi:hypothetical protein